MTIQDLLNGVLELPDDVLFADRLGAENGTNGPEIVPVQKLDFGQTFRFVHDSTQTEFVFLSERELGNRPRLPYTGGRWYRPYRADGEPQIAEYGQMVEIIGHIHGC